MPGVCRRIGTPGSQRICLRRTARKKKGSGLRTLLVLMASAILVACGSNGDGRSPTTAPRDPTQSQVIQEQGSATPASPSTTVPVSPSPTATPPAPLAALVNGEYVFLADVEKQMLLYEQALRSQGIPVDTEEGQLHLEEVQREVLGSLIDYTLVRQEAAALNIGVGDDQVEAQLEADIAAGGGQAAFEEWLLATGQTRQDYVDMLRRSMLSQHVVETVTADVPDEVEQVHVRHILTDSEEAARLILLNLLQGADFGETAKEQSLDLATKDVDGDLGWFPRGLVAPELEEAAFALQPGEVSDVIRIGEGYHIVQVLERELARPIPAELFGEYKLAVFDQWLAERRAAAEIEYYLELQADE